MNANLRAKFFRLVVVVALIKFGLFNQPLVSGRARGLIYNKDGKFIYRPPRSNQGHIIVIEDRPRENGHPILNREAAMLASSSSYSPYTQINHQQRMLQPDAMSLVNLLAPLVRGGGGGSFGMNAATSLNQAHQSPMNTMISLDDLQAHHPQFGSPTAVARHEFPAQATAPMARSFPFSLGAAQNVATQNLATSSALQQNLPLLQLMHPARRFNNIEGLNYLDAARAKSLIGQQQQQQQQHQQQQHHQNMADILADQSNMMTLDGQFPSQLADRNSIQMLANRLPFGSDSLPYEMPNNLNFAESASFLDDSMTKMPMMPGRGIRSTLATLGEFDQSNFMSAMRDDDKGGKLIREEFFDEQMPGKVTANEVNHNNNSINSQLEHGDRSRNKHHKKSSSARGNHNETRNKLMETSAPSNQILLRVGEDHQNNRGNRYWRQFRNQFDIVL